MYKSCKYTTYAKCHFAPLSSSTDCLPCHPQPKAPVSSSTESPRVILNRKRSASDWGSRDYSLDSRFHGNDTFFVIPHLMRDPSPPVILNRKRSASDWGSRDYRLDSRLRGNDTFFVIPNRKPPCHPQPKAKRFGLGIHPFLDSRFHGNDTFLSSRT